MYCPKCGTECSDPDRFCPKCGADLNTGASPARSTVAYETRGYRPKSDARLVSFVLGLILGLIGLLLAVIIYHNNRDFEEDPTGTAVVWSIFGMLFWFIVIFAILLVVLGASMA